MTYLDTLIQFTVLIGGTLGLATLFGTYIARLISFEMRPLEKILAKVGSGFYKLIGIDVTKQMTWEEYFFALFLTNVIVVVFVILVLTLQNYLPFSQHVKGLPIDLAFNTAIWFVTDTDLQHYAGEQQLSNVSQMIAITFTMFVAPASGIVAAFAFIRSFIRKNFGLGNFYMDFIRVIITMLLPVAFVSSLVLMTMGSPQTFNSHVTINTLEGSKQIVNTGPVASLVAIKQLGSNGGGFFGANSAHPFENPTGLSNMYEMFLMLIIPLSFPIAYAKLMGKGRGLSILAAMLTGFGSLLVIAFSITSGPSLLETRFGSFSSVLFNTISISTNTGAVNSSLLGMSPNAIVSLLLAMFVQAIPGAVGTGMITMIIYVILTLFIVGLMVGKTPEFMSMKISPKAIKLAVFIFLIHPVLILIPTVFAFSTGNAQAIIGGKVTPIEYTANNGSDYFGTSANTPFWNYSTAIVKDRKEVVEPIKTQGPLFISVLVVITFLLTALTFFPFLVIGPFSI